MEDWRGPPRTTGARVLGWSKKRPHRPENVLRSGAIPGTLRTRWRKVGELGRKWSQGKDSGSPRLVVGSGSSKGKRREGERETSPWKRIRERSASRLSAPTSGALLRAGEAPHPHDTGGAELTG